MPDRELVVRQAKRNTDIECGIGAFRRNGVAFYHYYRDGNLHITREDALNDGEYEPLNPA